MSGYNVNNQLPKVGETVNDVPSNTGFFMDAQHPLSQRHAILHDDGTSAWLYLTKPNTEKPSADAWVHNRVPAISKEEVKAYRGGPPPAAIGYASDTAICESPENHEWEFIWAGDGNSVAITKDGEPVACIIGDPKGSYSRELVKDGPWGSVWCETEFNRVF